MGIQNFFQFRMPYYSILVVALLAFAAAAAAPTRKQTLLPAYEPLKRQQEFQDLGGPLPKCEDEELCACGTNDMCCPRDHICCATGHSDENEARALDYTTRRPVCEDEENPVLRSFGFTNGTACAPADGACCEDGHACASGNKCCYDQCIPSDATCCPKTSSGVFGYCLGGLRCGTDNEFCEETTTSSAAALRYRFGGACFARLAVILFIFIGKNPERKKKEEYFNSITRRRGESFQKVAP